jgi:hypothetical protein
MLNINYFTIMATFQAELKDNSTIPISYNSTQIKVYSKLERTVQSLLLNSNHSWQFIDKGHWSTSQSEQFTDKGHWSTSQSGQFTTKGHWSTSQSGQFTTKGRWSTNQNGQFTDKGHWSTNQIGQCIITI